ncbi:hypothetical protein XELAEV_18039635mg [Xenopus laevis]|uniref:Helix-turn-helix domain-containing protein n=1 Tax=Xenopus laevis TaxID=8355 RepID=A0A974C854_XENLA|nr:hypothetical protein XELAEV_18039635mg [Xenopus laevis]
MFVIWEGPRLSLEQFYREINSACSHIKFTVHVESQEIAFLDTKVYVCGNKLQTDLFTKETDKNTLLHFSSFHPPQIKRSLTKSQFTRVRRIVSDDKLSQIRLDEMTEKFCTRHYPKTMIYKPRGEVEKVERKKLLTKSTRDNKPRIPFISVYNTLSDNISKIIKKHWDILKINLGDISAFQNPPVMTYWLHAVYMGQTSYMGRDRIREHKSAIKSKRMDQPLAKHFAEAGHTVQQLKFQILDAVPRMRRGGNRVKKLLYKEAWWIRKLDSLFSNGLNMEYDLSPVFR